MKVVEKINFYKAMLFITEHNATVSGWRITGDDAPPSFFMGGKRSANSTRFSLPRGVFLTRVATRTSVPPRSTNIAWRRVLRKLHARCEDEARASVHGHIQ